MLEQMRRSSQSLLIYVLFGIVIAVFIVNFGPQSPGGCESVGQPGFLRRQGGRRGRSRPATSATASSWPAGPSTSPSGPGSCACESASWTSSSSASCWWPRPSGWASGQRGGGRGPHRRVQDDRRWAASSRPPPPACRRTGTSTTTPSSASCSSSWACRPKAFIEQQKRELLAARVRNLLRERGQRLRGRGEGRVRAPGQPGEPGVRPLLRPALRGTRSS